MTAIRNPIAVAALALIASGAVAAPPGIRVDSAGFFTPDTGHSTEKVSNTSDPNDIPTDNGCSGKDIGDCGQMRVGCGPSHHGYDDPLLYPIGSVDLSHLHVFAGNTNTDKDTDQDVDPRTDDPLGNSTCRGGTVNTSRYWVPPVIDTRTGRPIAMNGNESVKVYYKGEFVNIIPPNFRMIAGNAASTTPQSTAIVTYGCNGTGCPGGVWSSLQGNAIPAGKNLFVMLDFPQCIQMDGLAPFGVMSGEETGWEWLTIGHGDDTNELMYRSTTADSNVSDIPVSGGGGAAAPVVTTVPGDFERYERAFVRFVDLTAGQSVTVAGRTYTSTGATTAAEVAKAMSGGTPLDDSPDFKAHVKYTTGGGPIHCPSTHRYRIPSIRFTAVYVLPAADTWRHLRLSCDTYSGPGGYCLHGDFRNGWKPEIMGSWINSCNRSGVDCHGSLLGNRDHNNDVLPSYRRINH